MRVATVVKTESKSISTTLPTGWVEEFSDKKPFDDSFIGHICYFCGVTQIFLCQTKNSIVLWAPWEL